MAQREVVAIQGVTDPEDASWTVPQTQIVCAASAPRRDVEKLTAISEGRFGTVDTGHNLMITEPDAVTELLPRLA